MKIDAIDAFYQGLGQVPRASIGLVGSGLVGYVAADLIDGVRRLDDWRFPDYLNPTKFPFWEVLEVAFLAAAFFWIVLAYFAIFRAQTFRALSLTFMGVFVLRMLSGDNIFISLCFVGAVVYGYLRIPIARRWRNEQSESQYDFPSGWKRRVKMDAKQEGAVGSPESQRKT